jgi:hypothetical protein
MKLLSTSFVFFPQTKRPCLIKRKISGVGRVAKVVENLPCKNKALSSNPSTIGKKKKKREKQISDKSHYSHPTKYSTGTPQIP